MTTTLYDVGIYQEQIIFKPERDAAEPTTYYQGI